MNKKIFRLLSLFITLFIGMSITNVKAASTLVHIDYPVVNTEVTNTLRIMGWVMSNTNTTIKAYVDNVEIPDIPRQARPDVINAVSGYGGLSTNPTPGFDKYFDISRFCYGGHNFIVQVYDSNNNLIHTERTTFRKAAPKTRVNIDMPSPTQEYSNTLRIMGWVMSQTNTTIKAYVDNVEVTDIPRQARPDVIKAISGYGGSSTNPTPGFDKYFDISKFGYGGHNFIVEVYDSNNNLIHTERTTFKKAAPKTRVNIDMPSPTQEYTDTLRIMGWVMSTANTKIRAFVDNVEVPDIPRQARPDVIKAISGYGGSSTNPTPGFDKYFDISRFGYGGHNFTVQVYDQNNNLIHTERTTFKKAAPKTRINIDIPSSSQEFTDTLRIMGWVMSTTKTTIKAYVDGVEVTDIPRQARPDVINAISGYGGLSTNPTPGFDKYTDITNLSYGTHSVKIEVYDQKNILIQSSTKYFKRIKSKSELCIDYPLESASVNKSVTISGWFLKSNNYTTIKMLVDNQEVSIDKFTDRSDVLKTYPGYSKTYNTNNGFTKTLDTKAFKYGVHTVKVQLIDNNGVVVNEKTKHFNKTKPAAKISIDRPLSPTNRNGIIYGWAITKYENTKIQILIDGTEINSYITEKRPDVMNAYPEYESYMSNSNPGFNGSYDFTSYPDGYHNITVKLINTDNNDIIARSTKKFKLTKYSGKIWIDYPTLSNLGSAFTLSGWEMSESPNSYIKIYADSYLLNPPITRVERPDVIEAIKDYGDASVNPTPGFTTTIDPTSWVDGQHTLRIELYSYLNELITTETKQILIYKGIYNGIDISQYNKVYSWSQVRNAPIDYMFARVAVRGYGINNQGIDGNLVADTSFESHVNGANSVGIKSGAYVFTQATNSIEAVAEANLALQKVYAVGGHSKIQLPIVYDVEFSGCYSGGVRCGRADNLDRESRTTIAIAFLETIRAAGYQPMIYASTSFLNNQLNMSRLSNYPVWVAHYGVNYPTYKGPFEVWQYSSTETVPGIYGSVDRDYFYKRY